MTPANVAALLSWIFVPWALCLAGLRLTEPSVPMTPVIKKAAVYAPLLTVGMFPLLLFLGGGRLPAGRAALLALWALPWVGLLAVAGLYWERRGGIWSRSGQRPPFLRRALGHLISTAAVLLSALMTLLPILSAAGLADLASRWN